MERVTNQVHLVQLRFTLHQVSEGLPQTRKFYALTGHKNSHPHKHLGNALKNGRRAMGSQHVRIVKPDGRQVAAVNEICVCLALLKVLQKTVKGRFVF
ncbi:JM121 [macacine gammaherpesvirus 11]|uniref:JM121 n=2 Tax=macacine gammaherpesvirus 11 TaxID=2560570 RepID=G9JMU9_9GAMA|nr:JM121 [Macaca fuscata rhadinovirus]AAT00098.1 JM121 [Macaca fuscata rhadinovirus]AEW87646.1 JM121 [Macaca fuscata rhadinovirus]AEW87816.1 JM121 [Macaca fuscata rhadinovirus]